VSKTAARVPMAFRLRPIIAATSSILAASFAAHAQQAGTSTASAALDEVIVTAQKRSENLQSVPISIQAFDTKKLADLQVASFDDYARYLPSLSVQSYGPGQAQLYVRGVTNGGDGVHVGSQPLVGVYIDEMPVTTIANNLDVHVYDMQRVEALSGPQGTLFGASSMAGTMRLITNKPDPSKFDAGYDITGEKFTAGDPGGKVEGFANIPIGENAAIRLVGWAEHDGGYINVVRSSPQYYPSSGAPRDNARFVEKNSNWVDTVGGRAALRFNINDTWTVTPTLMTQSQTAGGQYAYTPFATSLTPVYGDGSSGPTMTLGGTGDLNVVRYAADLNRDSFTMGTLVVEGKLSSLDVTYAGGYIKRNEYQAGDYSDYSLFYDVAYAYQPAYYGDIFHNQNGDRINPGQIIFGRNAFTKASHELRLATPSSWRLHGVLGLFVQRQTDEMRYDYTVPGIASDVSVDGSPGTVWLENASRIDRDSAVFTDMTFDVTPQLALTGGVRLYRYENTLYGFAGFGLGFPNADSPYTGENICLTPIDPSNHAMPCQNLQSQAKKSGETHRVNVTYKFDDDRMMYATVSTGFRPGGVNRLLSVPPYQGDSLTNFEVGAKTSWFDRRLRINGAVFLERWKDAQFAYPGQAGVNVVVNAGRATIKGVEAEVHWRASDELTLSTSMTFLDGKLDTNVCHRLTDDPGCNPTEAVPDNEIYAAIGDRLPVSARIKGNTIARYEWSTGEFKAHAQLAAIYQGNVLPALRKRDLAVLGTQPGYASVDLSFGLARNAWTTELYVQNMLDRRGEAIRYAACATATCKLVDVIPIRPRVIGVSFGRRF